MQEYNGILYNAVLTPDLNSNIIRSLPLELRITFNNKYTAFINLDPDNICSPAVFKFLNQYVENLNNSYKANPMLIDVRLSPMNVGVKPVRFGSSQEARKKFVLACRKQQGQTLKTLPSLYYQRF